MSKFAIIDSFNREGKIAITSVPFIKLGSPEKLETWIETLRCLPMEAKNWSIGVVSIDEKTIRACLRER